MVVPAGQATDGLTTVQVSQWSALCAAAVPSPSCCRPATHRHPGVQCPAPQLTTSQPRLVRRMGGRCLHAGMSVASTVPPRSIDFCVTCVKLSQDTEERRPSPPRRPPARPAQCRPVTRESLTAKCRRGMLTNHRPRCYVKRGGLTASQPISERHLKADTSGKKSIMMI